MTSDAKKILLALSLLLMIGVVMIYSSSAVYAYTTLGDSMYYLKRHIYYMAIGLTSMVIAMSLPRRFFQDYARVFMITAIILLLAVITPHVGVQSGGARRWINILGLRFQPSEAAKLAIIIYLADFASRKRFIINNFFYGFLPSFALIGFTAALVMLEPDMGTSVAIAFIGSVIMFTSGINLKYLAFSVLSVAPLFVFLIISAPYRLRRIIAFLNPWEDPQGKGFQLIQSFIALGSGGLIGIGLGESKQKLFYLPQSHTDFIYSIVGEELGFLGAITVLALFTVLIWYSFKLSLKIHESFASKAILGITIMIAFEVILNIGVSIGAFPTKGLPLPFISYGGTSLVIHMASMGILFNMSREVEMLNGI